MKFIGTFPTPILLRRATTMSQKSRMSEVFRFRNDTQQIGDARERVKFSQLFIGFANEFAFAVKVLFRGKVSQLGEGERRE